MSELPQQTTATTAEDGRADEAIAYFAKIPRWNTDGKRFEIMADAISGRVPVTRLESWRKFTDLLDDPFFNRSGTQFVYRGHRRYDWVLMPTLGRVTTNGIVTVELANQQLERFRLAVRGRLRDSLLIDDEDELWSIGQHHGLMTPLLDWTYSPYVALFFAFAKPDKKEEARVDAVENAYRAVYVLNRTFVGDDHLCPGIRLLEPRRDDHGRLVNQAGLFTFSPPDATIENKLANILGADDFPDSELREADEDAQAEILAKYICKIYIKNEDRDGCLRHLRRMNIHPASLFPDLLGAADHCNALTAEAQHEAEIREAAVRTPVIPPPDPGPPQPPEVVPIEPGVAQDLEELLRLPAEAVDVEPGRIPLIAEELAQEIEKNKLVDWQTRESVQARLRNVVRHVLRKYGYPIEVREQIVDRILELAIENSESESPS